MVSILLTRKASKTFLFLLLFIASLSFVMQPVNAQETETTEGNIADQAFIINPDWLSVSAKEFNGNPFDYTGKYNRLNVDIGGYGMTNFVNHGEVAVDSVTETHVYMAEMDYPVWVIVYTDCMIDDVYPNHITDTHDEQWLKLKTFRTWFFGAYKDGIDYNEYDVSYSRIGTPTINTHEYDGNLQLHVTINPDLPIKEGGIITVNGVQFKVPDIRVFIESGELLERTYGTCDDPQNFYTDNDGVIEIRKEDLQNLDFSHGSSGAKTACGDGLEHNYATPYSGKTTAKDEISWAGVHNRERIYGVTYTSGQVGQAFASSPTVGTVWSRDVDLNSYDEEFDFDSHIRIKPNIFYDMERFEVRHTYLYVDRYHESILPEYGLCDIKEEYVDTKTRTVGLGVQNIFIKMKYNFKVTMLLSIQPTSEEGESILEDPEVYQGDIIWDNTIGGTTDAKATISEPQTWATEIEDSWNKFWTDTGEWIDEQLDWWKEMGENLAGGWMDWWNNLPSVLSNWWKDFWWVFVIVAFVIVGVVGFYIFYPRIARGSAKALKEYQEPKSSPKPSPIY